VGTALARLSPPYARLIVVALSIFIVLDTGDAIALALLLFQEVDHAGRKLPSFPGRETFGALNLLPTIFGCLSAEKKALCNFFR
jgi:hypothetical protein